MSAQTLTAAIETLEQSHHLVWNSWAEKAPHWQSGPPVTVSGKEQFAKNILQKFEETNGLWREKSTGRKVDINEVLLHELQTRGPRQLIRNQNLFSSYVSPFKKRDEGTITKHMSEMSKVIKAQIEKSNYVFVSEESERKIIEILAKNFLAQDTENGIRYHRISSEGVVSPKEYSFEEMGQQFGFNRFVDDEKTDLQQKLVESNIRIEAEKVIGRPLVNVKGQEDKEVRSFIDRVKKVDAPKSGKRLNIDSNFIKEEFRKQAVAESGIQNPTSHEKMMFERNAKFRMEELNRIEDLAPHFNEITIPTAQEWENL